jgi:chromosome segregation ATPase
LDAKDIRAAFPTNGVYAVVRLLSEQGHGLKIEKAVEPTPEPRIEPPTRKTALFKLRDDVTLEQLVARREQLESYVVEEMQKIEKAWEDKRATERKTLAAKEELDSYDAETSELRRQVKAVVQRKPEELLPVQKAEEIKLIDARIAELRAQAERDLRIKKLHKSLDFLPGYNKPAKRDFVKNAEELIKLEREKGRSDAAIEKLHPRIVNAREYAADIEQSKGRGGGRSM